MLEFKQEPFLRPYIKHKDLERVAEKEGNKIKKQICKSVENPMNKVNVKVVTTRKQYLKWSVRILKRK